MEVNSNPTLRRAASDISEDEVAPRPEKVQKEGNRVDVTSKSSADGWLQPTPTFRLQYCPRAQQIFWPNADNLSRLMIDKATGEITFKGIRKGYFRWNTALEGIADGQVVEVALREQLAEFKLQRTDEVRTRSMLCCPLFFSPLRAALQTGICTWFSSLCHKEGRANRDQWLAAAMTRAT